MPTNTDNLMSLINRNKSKKLAANKIIETSPLNIPVLSKLTRASNKIYNPDNRVGTDINKALFESIFTRLKNLKKNTEFITKLFPDVELVIQILVSSILSPKKMTDVQLLYKLNDKVNLPFHISSELLKKIEDYINKEYKIEEKLATMIREALFDTGSYVVAVIPESSVDEIINKDMFANISTESFKARVDIALEDMKKPLNFLNIERSSKLLNEEVQITKTSFIEHLISQENLLITDNFNILKLPVVKDSIRKTVVKSSIRNNSISLESREKIQYLDIFRSRSTNGNFPVETIKTKSETRRKSLGKPLYLKINSEAVLPVFTPGDETNHIGYFVVLDDFGQPLSADVDAASIRTLNEVVSGSANSAQLSITQKAYRNLLYDNTDGLDVVQLYELYSQMVEKQLYSTIKNSIYNSNIKIPNISNVYQLMFARALAEQKTTILFIPSELVMYLTFYYNEIGIGKSLLENLSILSSLRSILLFARIMSYTKQAIDVTKVNISLDPNDPDPEKTIEQVQDSVLKLRQNYFPLGINNPVDLIDWIQRAGLQFAYDNHPGIPNVKIDFENANVDHTVPPSELEEELRRQTIISLGLSPETIDTGFSPEFATTVVNNNILLSKRVTIYQNILIQHLNKLILILSQNDEELRIELIKYLQEHENEIGNCVDEDMKKLFIENKTEFFSKYLDKFVENIYLELPRPVNTNLVNLSAEYELYKESLDKVLDSIISPEFITNDLIGDVSNHVESIRNNFKHYLLRKWMNENNYYTEAFELAQKDEKTIAKTLELMTSHLSNVMSNSVNILSDLEKFKLAANKDLEKLGGAIGSGGEMDMSITPEETETEDTGEGEKDEDLDVDDEDILKM